MKILIACEYSGIVRDAFIEFGHDAISCDLIPTESIVYRKDGTINNDLHHIGDVLNFIKTQEFDMMIAHPPCTYLCSSGLHWNTRRNNGELTPAALERQHNTKLALSFITDLWNAPIPRIVIENPVGCINTRLPFMPKPQYVQPYQYGHDASKKTGLWMKNLPMLGYWSEDYIEPRVVCCGSRKYNRWANQTDSGQNALAPSSTRGKDRAKTYTGIAYAMVEAWGDKK